jgi:hypothetical protein
MDFGKAGKSLQLERTKNQRKEHVMVATGLLSGAKYPMHMDMGLG